MDLLGKKFGRLTVIDSFKKDGYSYYNCICECGNKVVVYQGSLVSGATKSCGCYNIEKLKERRKDLVGKTFGRWKVLEYEGEGMYKCQCSCENHTISLIHAQSLKSGNSTSCGCIKHEKRRERLNSYIGRQFGDFTVESVVDYESRRIFFNVRCKNGHVKKVRGDNLKKLTVCSKCNKKEVEVKEKRIPIVVNIGDKFGKLIVTDVYKKNNRTMCKCRCDCGNELEIYKGSIYKRTSCGKCRKQDLIGKTFGRWRVDSYDKLLDKWKCICSCEEHNVSYLTTSDLNSGHSKSCGCYNREIARKRFKDFTGQRFGKLVVLYRLDNDANTPIRWVCKCDCGNETIVSASNLGNGHTMSCGNCGFGSSMGEQTIRDFIKELSPNIKIEKVKILGGKEIDIYLPEYKLGIEYNGSAYHASINGVYSNKPKDYHQQKFLLAKEKGIHLINIFDVDWIKNENKIKMYIEDLLKDKINISARDCEIRYVDLGEAVEFVDKYNLKGSCKRYMKINIGLFYSGELISLVSFCNLRMRSSVVGEFELYRYVVKHGYIVVGGADKLFSEFIKKFNPIYIRGYSDNDYFLGGIYIKLGFEYKGQVTPNYYWLYKNNELMQEDCMVRRLKVYYPDLYKESVESQVKNKEDYIMTKLGAKKIFRSGSTKWEWRK